MLKPVYKSSVPDSYTLLLLLLLLLFIVKSYLNVFCSHVRYVCMHV